jgi:anti-sigma regulatory factor (Ser/Thr protein kinase)
MTMGGGDAGVQRQRLHLAGEADVFNAAVLAYAWVQQTGARTLLATEAATMVSELGMNIIKYAGRGNLTLVLQERVQGYFEVLARDHGPGIADLRLAMAERYSSKGTLGLGLPGVRRMADDFEIHSSTADGTSVRARRWLGGAPVTAAAPAAWATPAVGVAAERATPQGWQQARLQRPCDGELVCGDGVVLQPVAGGLLAGVLDVLGHGEDAHRLARHCERWLVVHAQADVVAMVEGLHAEVRGSLGLALSLAFVDGQTRGMTVAGVGNTRLFCLTPPGIAVEAQPGIVGARSMPRLRPVRVQTAPHDTLVLLTDGISERLLVGDVLPWRHLAVQPLAQHLLRTHGKSHDDVTCMVLRCPA